MRLGQRRLRLVLALLLAATGLIGGGCSSWTLAHGELERAGQAIHSQARVMELVATAAIRDNAPTVSLGVMVDDAAKTLAKQERKISGLGTDPPREEILLKLSDRLSTRIAPLRSAVDDGDTDRLRRIRQDVTSVASRLESMGVS